MLGPPASSSETAIGKSLPFPPSPSLPYVAPAATELPPNTPAAADTVHCNQVCCVTCSIVSLLPTSFFGSPSHQVSMFAPPMIVNRTPNHMRVWLHGVQPRSPRDIHNNPCSRGVVLGVPVACCE